MSPNPTSPWAASRSIGELITGKPAWGLGMRGYGIDVLTQAGQSLDEVCKRMGFTPQALVEGLERQVALRTQAPQVAAFPTELVMQYLHHAHRLFIQERLPYLQYLIGALKPEDALGGTMVEDLKILFPLFADEFIEHIHHEEDRLFTYIRRLLAAARGKACANGALWLDIEKNSIAHLSEAHEAHDDEMEGIRQITGNYKPFAGMSLALQLLFFELQQFERDLIIHAGVENHVLFPRALRLEGYVAATLKGICKWN